MTKKDNTKKKSVKSDIENKDVNKTEENATTLNEDPTVFFNPDEIDIDLDMNDDEPWVTFRDNNTDDEF